MLSKCQIVVLHTIKHSDKGIVVNGYTNTNGKEAFYIYNRGKNAKINQLSPLNIVDAVVYSKHSNSYGVGLPIIKELSSPFKLFTIRTDIRKATIAIFICELFSKSIKEVESNPQLYNFMLHSILLLESIEKGIENYHLHFIINLSKQMGYMPVDNYSEQNRYFDFTKARFCEDENKSLCFTLEESKLLHLILSNDIKNLEDIKCSGSFRSRFIERILEYLSFHIGGTLDLKSLSVLNEVFKN